MEIKLTKADCEELLIILDLSTFDYFVELKLRERFAFKEFKEKYFADKEKWSEKLKKGLQD